MGKAVLNIENRVYLEIEVEDTDLPPTPNFLSNIYLHEGFGIGIPTAELHLHDQRGTLADELSLMTGKKISIGLGKTSRKQDRREYRLWAMDTIQTHVGPMLKVVCILDCPLYSTTADVKAYKGPSSSVMGRIAAESGLQYDAPDPTSDHQWWLRSGITLNGFSEDMALAGYAGPQACLARVLTSLKVLRYKDLFAQLKEQPLASFLFNTPPSVATNSQNRILVREVKPVSKGGALNQWLNYGHRRIHNDLSGTAKVTDGLMAPSTEGNSPISSQLFEEVTQSKFDYVGPDTGIGGTAPNVHENYNKAQYQNPRFMAMWTDSVKLLIEEYSELSPLDAVDLHYTDLKSNNFVDNKRYEGKYLVGNRTISIKDGTKFCELVTVVRPNVGNAEA